MSSADLEYYRHRAVTEHALAKESGHAGVAAIHEELARQYEALMHHEELRLQPANVVDIRRVA